MRHELALQNVWLKIVRYMHKNKLFLIWQKTSKFQQSSSNVRNTCHVLAMVVTLHRDLVHETLLSLLCHVWLAWTIKNKSYSISYTLPWNTEQNLTKVNPSRPVHFRNLSFYFHTPLWCLRFYKDLFFKVFLFVWYLDGTG